MVKYQPDDLFFDLEIRQDFFVCTQYYPASDQWVISFLEKLPRLDQNLPKPHVDKPEVITDLQTVLDKLLDQHEPVLSNKIQTTLQQNPAYSLADFLNEFGNQYKQKLLNYGIDLWSDPQAKIHVDDPRQLKLTDNIRYHYAEDQTTITGIDVNTDSDGIRGELLTPNGQAGDNVKLENLLDPVALTKFAKRYGIQLPALLDQNAAERGKSDFDVVYDTDDAYDPKKMGLRIGYNSVGYDQTFLAHFLGDIVVRQGREVLNNLQAQHPDVKDFKVRNDQPVDAEQLTPQLADFADDFLGVTSENAPLLSTADLTKFNTYMFNQENHQMANALSSSPFGNAKAMSVEQSTYLAWKMSNRFVDVSALNPKRISLKRTAMALGYKIEESASNRNPTAPLGSRKEMLDVINYNINDVYITMKLFEYAPYYNRFKQNKQLLAEFPALIYEQDRHSDSKLAYLKGPDYVQRFRLTTNSTSAQFVTKTIAPYKNTKIKDNDTLNLMYPDQKVAERMNEEGKLPANFIGKDGKIHPLSVLEYIQQLLDEDFQDERFTKDLHDRVQAQFDKIKAFYNQFVGKNFNFELDELYNDPVHPNPEYIEAQNPRDVVKDGLFLNIKYITPEPIMVNGEEIASYINLSIGGVHGVEVREGRFKDDLKAYQTALTRQQRACDWINEHCDPEEPVTLDTLGEAIAQYILPDEPFTHVKKAPLEFDPDYTWGDLLLKSASRKRPKLKTFKEPTLLEPGTTKVRKIYQYTSTDVANHEDFDSYYPSLISNLAIFRNADGHDVFTDDLYHPRLKLKHMAKDRTNDLSEEEREAANLRQLSMKLLINSASGAGDASFNSNIRCNNKMIAMRIIGQLFAWYIGQSLALHGARVPSTNTDGLYTMGIEPELNNQIVEAKAAKLLLKIDPEELQLFVSKDANNRLESEDQQWIASARGAALTSWQGPTPLNAVDHPAVVDYILALYLTRHANVLNLKDHSVTDEAFNPKIAKVFLEALVLRTGLQLNVNMAKHLPTITGLLEPMHSNLTELSPTELREALNELSDALPWLQTKAHPWDQGDLDPILVMRLFQFPTVAKPGSGQIMFQWPLDPETNQPFDDQTWLNNNNQEAIESLLLNPTNRVYLTKTSKFTIRSTGLHVVSAQSAKTRVKKLSTGTSFRDIIGDRVDPIADAVLKQTLGERAYRALYDTNYNPTAMKGSDSSLKPRDIIRMKLPGFPQDHPVELINGDLHQLSPEAIIKCLTNLNLDSYLKLVETAFTEQWQN